MGKLSFSETIGGHRLFYTENKFQVWFINLASELNTGHSPFSKMTAQNGVQMFQVWFQVQVSGFA